MVWSLLSTKWLPVRFKDGSTGKFAPADLADENVIDIAATRPDLQGAAWQFLLGLLQSSLAPSNRESWEDIWEDGLTPEAVQKAFAPLDAAFQFGSESPSFMQDFAASTVKKSLLLHCCRRSPVRKRSGSTKICSSNAMSLSVSAHTAPRWHCSRYS